jgi:hypothetical protein
MGFSLEDQITVKQGDLIDQDNFTTGRSFQVWIALLQENQDRPPLVKLTCEFDVSPNSTFITLRSLETVTLYRNQVLQFNTTPTLSYVVIKSTTVINGSINVPIFPLENAITATAEALFYKGITPFMSVKEGALPDTTSSLAEAHNKNMSYYSVSEKIKEDYMVEIEGDVNVLDPCLGILRDRRLSKIFVQVQHSLYTKIGFEQYGEGYFAVEYKGVPTVTIDDPESDMVNVTLQIKVSGKLNKSMMFGLTGILEQPPATINADLLLSFHDGSFTDLITPSRLFTLDANAYIGYPYRYGSKYANTSLIVSNKSLSKGCYCTNLTGLNNIGATEVNYTLEFWVSNAIPNGTARIRLLSGATQVFDFSGSGTTGIGVTFHGQNLSFPIANHSRRTEWNHYAFVREKNSVRNYLNGVLINTFNFASSNFPISEIQLGGVTSGVPASNSSFMDLNINYFAISLSPKYTVNFNPNTDTGFSYYYPESTTEYCN